MKHSAQRCCSSGQVLVVGIFILIALLLLFLAGFDIHSALRAKLKLETAQEAAALAGAEWQRKSLNLLGDLNVVKACAVLLEGDDNWQIPLPHLDPKDPDSAARRTAALQSRIDVLTEMQTRVSFIGPLIGFAAAQQTAKANGMPVAGTLDNYIELLDTDTRYKPEGGAPEVINRYRWKAPYRALLYDISQSGIALWPNARTAGSMSVYPDELKKLSLYRDILSHYDEIKKAAGKAIHGDQKSWNDTTLNFVLKDRWKNRFASPPWWSIDFESVAFPKESEIFSLGIEFGASAYAENGGYSEKHAQALKNAAPVSRRSAIYADADKLPDSIQMKWCCYDNTWYPEYYRQNHTDYDADHFNYWFRSRSGDGPLRRNIKTEYRYEGPAAYVEGAVVMGRTLQFHTGQTRTSNAIGREFLIGSKRESEASDERSGAIARCFGALEGEKMPIELPLVLPVFDKVSIVPTYMPIPYGFAVLRDKFSDLERFLSWLARQNALQENPADPLPKGCESFLFALQILTDGPGFRYYGWNPAHNEQEFDLRWCENLQLWYRQWKNTPDLILYSPQMGPSNPGWFQEPQLFSGEEERESTETTETVKGGTRIYVDYTVKTSQKKKNNKDEDVYVMKKYYVVTPENHIITNAEADPTIQILGNSPSSPGEWWSSGNFGGGSGDGSGDGSGSTPGYTRDTSKGPRRL